tara:strand:- start:4032 stop:4442 length:411 start_codon:yes stop_codon:yes gene_type:complete
LKGVEMKKVALIFILSYLIMGSSLLVTAGSLTPDYDMFKGYGGSPAKPKPEPEQIKPLNEILVYCNTKDFIEKMVKNEYRLNLAAKGTVNDERHTELMQTQLWLNPANNQYAIIFIYKGINRSCILGGNDIELYSP